MVGIILVFESGRDNVRVQFLDNPSIISGKTTFVLDMDYFLVNPGNIQINEAEQWVVNAHKNVENIFEAVLTDETKKLFN
jgi:uncharacterized protein (TIGR04255 family)